MTYDVTGSPLSLGGLKLKNRIIFAPTSLGLNAQDSLEKLEKIAAGGCAMIIIGDIPVGRPPHCVSLRTKKGMAYFRKLTGMVHKYDCAVCAQLHQSDSDLPGMIKYIPGVLSGKISQKELRPLLNALTGPYISRIPAKKLQKIAESFGSAALLAKKAGFDMVQIHGDRMCGSLSSPLFNRRSDSYGKTLAGRARFALEAVSAVRDALPSFPIDFKLAVRQETPHYGNAGFLTTELPQIVPLLERAGVTSFHVTLANHSSLNDTIPPARHPYFSEEGCFLPYCDIVRRYTDLPLCGAGGLSDPGFIEKQLKNGRIDCASMSRQLIADPLWPQKVLEGRSSEIRRCIRCNRDCLGGIQRHEGVHCIYERKNP